MILVDLVAASGSAVYVLLGAAKWVLGRRADALTDFEASINVLLYVILLQITFSTADAIAGWVGLSVSLNNTRLVSALLQESSSVFANASRLAIDTILYVQTERAALAAAPITSPLASVLGAATGWSVTELSVVAIIYMHLSFASRAFALTAPFLATVGAVLLPIPRLRRWGGTFLAIYLSVSLGLLYSGSATAKALSNIRRPSPINPIDWINIASIVGDIAVALGEAATITVLALSLATVAGVGLAGVFDGIYVNLLRV
ncbi:hypothetical protein IG193_04130 [Infirmifilum lucidum]|uniref:Uncharacterized protein n=1 Tax=Infirmifilum lucidum TaxID=2776706 RepID=A0A7L9FIP9_9CREN|nr:hypothetical protein [Infirmifilum lucidum]QOJ79650.1 hypothetical protein IG193_04130 [Infirmifilum lucidum]